ncbi:MAG TPA: hypothetical protein VFE23_22555 [Usitatibacter sp.]|jgi:hypothetical protein|nr:hypothetical protein [Usitatibacter sp.]
MKTSRFVPVLAGAVLLSSAAHGQAFRTYLASYGDDANPCTVGAPCRLLPAALSAVASGGEIWILDSANFNQSTVDIGKSVSIAAVPGQTASIVAVAGAPAMTVTLAGLKISMQNLVIAGNAVSPGTDGVVMTSISSLAVDRCTFVNLPGRAIVASPSAGGAASLSVNDSFFRANGSTAVLVENGTVANVSRSVMTGNGENILANGSFAGTTTTADVTDTIITGGGFGVRAASAAPGANARAFITRSTIHATGQGLSSSSGASFGTTLVAVTNSTVAGNAVGYFQSGGPSVVKSLGNNYIDENGSDTGTLTPGSVR